MTAASIGDGEGAFARGSFGVVVARADGRLLRANSVFQLATGLDLKSSPCLTLRDVFDESVDVSALIAILRRFGRDREIVPSRSVAFRRYVAGEAMGSGQAEVSLLDWCDAEGHVPSQRMTLSFVDITEGKGPHVRLDAHVRIAETRYKDIYENIVEGIYRSSLDGIQLSANPALVHLNGYESEVELLRAVNDIGKEWYVDPTRRAEFSRLLFTHGHVRDFVSEIYRHKTRERIWISEKRAARA